MPELGFAEDIEIGAPVDAVYAYRLEFMNLPEYNPNVSNLRRTDRGAELGAGAEYAFDISIEEMGGQGIGRAYALRFSEEGAKVAVADLNDDGGQEVAKEIDSAGGEAAFVHVDVSDEESTLAMARAVHERFGRIDVLVNNAGIYADL